MTTATPNGPASAAHTPTPWRATKINGKRDCLVNALGGRITYFDDDAVRAMEHAASCVNAHDKLVAALRDLLTYCDKGDPSYAQGRQNARALLAEVDKA